MCQNIGEMVRQLYPFLRSLCNTGVRGWSGNSSGPQAPRRLGRMDSCHLDENGNITSTMTFPASFVIELPLPLPVGFSSGRALRWEAYGFCSVVTPAHC